MKDCLKKQSRFLQNKNFDRGSFDRKSLDRNCHFSVDRNFHNQLTEIFDAFQLIKSFNNEFDQTPKN
jgi:hypothetical protein